MTDDVTMPRRLKRTAIYLIGHGAYREPRPIELQFLRVLRCRDILTQQGRVPNQPFDTFVDLNWPRRTFRGPDDSNFPNCSNLLHAVRNGEYEHVFVDIFTRPFDPDGVGYIQHSLVRAGANVIDASGDDILQRYLQKEFGQTRPPANADAMDFIAFFPALAATITENVLEDELEPGHGQPSTLLDAIHQRVNRLGEQHGFFNGNIPLLPDRLMKRMYKARDARDAQEKARRMETELLYCVGPYSQPLLSDDIRDDETPRADLVWAEKRVISELGFEKITDGRIVTYRRVLADWDVYADIRVDGRIRITAYSREDGAHNRSIVSIPDWWRVNLEEKMIRKVAATTAKEHAPCC